MALVGPHLKRTASAEGSHRSLCVLSSPWLIIAAGLSFLTFASRLFLSLQPKGQHQLPRSCAATECGLSALSLAAAATPSLGPPSAEAGSGAKGYDGFYAPHSRPSCKFINFRTSCAGSWPENARVTESSQGLGNDLSPDAFSPPTDTQGGETSDCRRGTPAVVGGKETARVQFVPLVAWGAELSLALPSPCW